MSGPAVFVLNAGSSTLKYQLVEPATGGKLAGGSVERIGQAGGAPDMAAAVRQALDALSGHPAPAAVGHRVVHGGELFAAATRIDDGVLAGIEGLAVLAPLHNPSAVAGIRAAREALPDVPQVAVFDTAFHRTIPAEAATYAIDRDLAARYGIHRYGFHGTSYAYVSRAAADFLGRPVAELKQIVLHLGNGASACAIDGGVSIDTTMGLTPLEGLVMGTRSGDLDPSIVFTLQRQAGMSTDEVEALLNKRSGLAGLAGHADLRDVLAAAEAGDDAAELALAVTAHRIRRYLGAYLVHLGGLDAIVFTAGIGEHAAALRHRVLQGLEHLGIRFDEALNAVDDGRARRIGADDSAVELLVVPTDEELEIARQAIAVLH